MANGEKIDRKPGDKPFAKALEKISQEPVKGNAASTLAVAAAIDAAPSERMRTSGRAGDTAKKDKKIRAASKGKPAAAIKAPTPDAENITIKSKDTIMADANTANTSTFTAQDTAATVQDRMKAAYDKGSELTAEATEFQKGNLEAMVESGKILAAGMQDIGRTYVEEAKTAVETAQDDVRKMAAVKSPTELFQLQGEIARRNFDAMIATTSKNSEAFLKLANEAFAPMSSRMSLAAEKFSKAA